MQEIWKDIKGYEGLYMVSDYGNIKSLNYGQRGIEKLLKSRKDTGGYYKVSLSKRGVSRQYFIHKIVAETFLENPNQYPEANHKDENKSNNHASNLEWCTRQYNLHYGTRIDRMANGLKRPVIGVNLKTGEILNFSSLKEADRSGYDSNYIWQCCTGRKKVFKDCVWKYAAETTRSMRAKHREQQQLSDFTTTS